MDSIFMSHFVTILCRVRVRVGFWLGLGFSKNLAIFGKILPLKVAKMGISIDLIIVKEGNNWL